jgi:hypothetical protein
MLWDSVFWVSLVASLTIGAIYFRDLGDISQMVIKVKRKNTIRSIRYEYQILAIGFALSAVMAISHLAFDGGLAWAFWIGLGLIAFLYGFPFIWVHVGLRNQQHKAQYYSIEEARKLVNPSTSVLVIDHAGAARAHPDYELSRPHLASTPEGLGGEDVMMAYCSMANLGIGYKAEIDGKKIELEVLAQHGNNLLLRDKSTNEPIQHIYGQRECDMPAADGKSQCDLTTGRAGMPQWPTYRMTFRGFQKAYPEGVVFLNRPTGNSVLRVFDALIDAVFSISIAQHHREETPVIENMTHSDDRLPNKTYVWGINIGSDAVAYTDDFVVEHDNIVNASIGGRVIVIAYDPKLESLGAWYNDSGVPVTQIDFYGVSDQGNLTRVESMKPGMFWHVWAEFFPATDINRIEMKQTAAA